VFSTLIGNADISKMCQHLLLALFFSSEYGVGLKELKLSYESLHPRLCARYGEEHGPKDFEEALRTLEGGFVKISGPLVSFVNPSLRDYLTEYLNDDALLREIAASAVDSDFARAVWSHCKTIRLPADGLAAVAMCFVKIAGDLSPPACMDQNTWKTREFIAANRSLEHPTDRAVDRLV
jgi:hypothetical protein